VSFGFGSEYKYDWGNFENRGSYTASTKGHMKNFGIFANSGYKFNNNQIFSIYIRSDNHNTTKRNETYKLNFTQIFGPFEFSATHSTGLRNPTLYELYGTDNYGIKGNINLDPEKSKKNELSSSYSFLENLIFTSTAYRATIFDQIETNSAYTQHENIKIDINQEGWENELLFKNDNQRFSIFSNFTKSRKTNGQAQSRRPDLTYGANYLKKIKKGPLGELDLNINYKYTGKYIDWDGSKNLKQKSTDIIDISFNKYFFDYIFSFNITNLLDVNYEKPATYSQDGRKIMFKLKKTF
jgi:outer membrane cobalamin receptor